MSDYLVELGCEEIPARFIDGMIQEFKQLVSKALEENQISYKAIKSYATYRRLTLIVSDIATKQSDQTIEMKGPPVRISISQEGAFLPPALGFAKKMGVAPNQLKQTNMPVQKAI